MVPWYLYAGFIAFVIAMLLVDLKLFHAEGGDKEPSVKQSASWVAVWVGLALTFGVIVWFWKGGESSAQYFVGYLIEYSLSVDNMFVFIVIFGYFNVPLRYQHQVLFYGILGAIVFRGLFIAIGVALIRNFEWIIYVFGAFLLYTAYRVARGATEDIHPEDNPVLKFARRRFRTTTKFDGDQLFTMENGKRLATPLFICLLFIETTDVVFALDSIPAIFGITKDPFIILTSNVFAVLGLRALYFLLAGGLKKLHLLNYGLAFVLAFVGVKMLLEAVPCGDASWICKVEHGEGHIAVPIWLSLAVIVTALTVTTILSFIIPPPPEEDDKAAAHNPATDPDGAASPKTGQDGGSGTEGPSSGGGAEPTSGDGAEPTSDAVANAPPSASRGPEDRPT
ncbi:MAG: TerC/Alx family metal homeostasis membrane protein [Actinomycetota bacterium]|nr:TerC/Alx family metal homeostasis membrane protein [Actinomycetota bacterium]